MLTKAAGLTGKAIGAGMVAKDQATNRAQHVAGLAQDAVVKVGDAAYDKLTPSQQETLKQGADRARETAAAGAAKGAELGGVMAEGFMEGRRVAGEQIAATKQAAFEMLDPEDQALLIQARENAQRKKDTVKAYGVDTLGIPVLNRVLKEAKTRVIAAATADRDMPITVCKGLESTIEEVWEDVAQEVRASVCNAVLRKTPVEEIPPISGCSPYRRFRAWLLHHYLPHNKSFFGKAKTCSFWVITLLSLVPLYAIRQVVFLVVLFCICVPGKPDTFQLTTFALRFRGVQVLSGGLLTGMIGGFQYELCAHDDEGCEDRGPGRVENFYLSASCLALDFFIFHFALFMLSYSEPHGKPTYVTELKNHDTTEQKQGGRITSLRKYDFCAALLAVGTTLALWAYHGKAEPAMFWGRVAFALLSFPFFPLALPAVGRLFTHAIPTGYTRRGQCMAMQIPSRHETTQ